MLTIEKHPQIANVHSDFFSHIRIECLSSSKPAAIPASLAFVGEKSHLRSKKYTVTCASYL
jgi:hypothetical protein